MPIKQCQRNNKKGVKYGDKGKCYLGKGGRSKALKQMRAIRARGGK
jgi:hypothetical protein